MQRPEGSHWPAPLGARIPEGAQAGQVADALVALWREIDKADPSIQVQINQETGENLMSGMGELHLEITEYRISHDHKMEIVCSEPIVVYRETVGKPSPYKFDGQITQQTQ